MGFKETLKAFVLYFKNKEKEQMRLEEEAWSARRMAGGRLLSRRAEGLKKLQLIFEKIDPYRPQALRLLFEVDSEAELEFTDGELPEGLALAVANGLRRQGPEAMDAFSAQLRELSAKALGRYSRWGGRGSDEILAALDLLRPESEAMAIGEAMRAPAKASAKARRL